MRVLQKSASEAARKQQTPEEEYNLDAWREQVDMARRQSASAYVGFLDSLFFYYRESVMMAERDALRK